MDAPKPALEDFTPDELAEGQVILDRVKRNPDYADLVATEGEVTLTKCIAVIRKVRAMD